MYKKIAVAFFAAAVCSVVAVGNYRPNSAQGSSQTAAQGAEQSTERRVAVNLIRAINTGEVAYQGQPGGFLDWSDLSQSPSFTSAIDHFSRGTPQLKDINLNDPSQIFPGWRLRLTLAPDKKSYVVFLSSISEKGHNAFVSDEEGIIWQASAL